MPLGDDAVAERQTLTRSLADRLGREERLEHAGARRFRDAGASDPPPLTEEGGLVWQANGQEKRYREIGGYLAKRGGLGRLAPRGFPRNDRFR